ncbi:hypothetical protein ACIBG7_12785 [Nonomuraea sp. NPDC050328]|uniref:hypothetical protein n=1 Tax=Nonomuraea sp. NPDC050328 TaxID=3364361 RepID=UPI0037B36F2D
METLHIWDAELGYSHTTLARQVETSEHQPIIPDGAEPMWGVYFVQPDTAMHGTHSFPHVTFEWRAAEYGIDPEDVDTLLDVILYEPYIPNPDDALAWQQPETAKILAATRGLPTCWTPGVPDHERLAAHQERLRQVKLHRLTLEPAARTDRQGALEFVGSRRMAPTDPLDPIRSQTRLDPVRVAARRLAVDWQRETQGYGAPATFTLKPPATFAGMQGGDGPSTPPHSNGPEGK